MRTWLVDEVMRSSDFPNWIRDPHRQVATAPRFRCDAITEYFFNGTDQELWGFEDFPSLRPPFEAQWFETDRPTAINSNGHVQQWDVRPDAWCACVRHLPLPGPAPAGWGVESLLAVDLFCLGRRGLLPPVAWMIPLHADGTGHEQPLDGGKFLEPALLHGAWKIQSEEEADLSGLLQAMKCYRDPILLALSFLNCRNVHTVERQAPREIRRRPPHPTWTYREIEIAPMKKHLDQVRSEAGVSLQRALHICRGHFADYSTDKPLFGKLTGRFWRPHHLRGDVAAGVRVKDYRVGRS